jgi:hypothetical protein
MTHNTKTILSYKGVLTFDKINDLLIRFKDSISTYDVSLLVKKRIYSIIVESLENTYKHSYTIGSIKDEKIVKFELLKDFDCFKIKTGNLIEKEYADLLIKKINYINSLDKYELKEFYKKSLLESEISEKKGAGLGLIEIAKTSNKPIEYKVMENKKNLFLTTTVIISNI